MTLRLSARAYTACGAQLLPAIRRFRSGHRGGDAFARFLAGADYCSEDGMQNDKPDNKPTLPTRRPTLPAPPPGAKPDDPPVARRGGTLSLRPLWQIVPRLAVAMGWSPSSSGWCLSVMFPPVFTRSSERAQVNSPVNLVTTPVEGIVTKQIVAVGSTFAQGQSPMTLPESQHRPLRCWWNWSASSSTTRSAMKPPSAKLEGN